MTHTCPVCDATTKADGTPFKSRESLIAHMSGKRDDAHSGIGPQTAKNMLEADDAVNGADGDSEGEVLEVSAVDDDAQTAADGGETCPACGADAGDTSGLSDGDRVQCTECGEVLVWSDE